MKLLEQMYDVEVFEHEGRFFLGSKTGAVKAFIHNNPEQADFSVWLQDTHIELNQSKWEQREVVGAVDRCFISCVQDAVKRKHTIRQYQQWNGSHRLSV